jgi:hypothetical protein
VGLPRQGRAQALTKWTRRVGLVCQAQHRPTFAFLFQNFFSINDSFYGFFSIFLIYI